MSGQVRETDWDGVRARLEKTALNGANVAAAEARRRDEIWRRRAVRLGARDAGAAGGSGRRTLLAFELGDETYALDLCELSQVAPCRNWTPVPGAPAALLGLTSLRGDTCVVINMRRLLELPEADVPPRYLVMLRQGEDNIGLAVDRLDRVRSVEVLDIRAPDRETLVADRFLAGITTDALLILDAGALRANAAFAGATNHGGARTPEHPPWEPLVG